MKEKILQRLNELKFDDDAIELVLELYEDNQEQLKDLENLIFDNDFDYSKRNEMLEFALEQNPDVYQPVVVIDDDEFERQVKEGIIDEDGNVL